jgi:hypothetical protein
MIYFTAATLPGDVAGLVGIVGKGIKNSSKLYSGGRVFWSGGLEIAGKAAMDFAKANGMETLEMTVKGRILTKLTELTSYKLTKPLWEKASASFARGAKGTVHVFQNATDGVRLNSLWRNTEYPILRDNVNIIYHDVFK